MTWTVTRQRQWPDGDLVVEISSGGIDYTNPDALAPKYAFEFEAIEDPRDAVEIAINIAQEWQKEEEEEVLIARGSTGGMTMPFSGETLCEETFQELRDWANNMYNKFPKCPSCGEPLGRDRYSHELEDEYEFCSEYCAEKDFERVQEEMPGEDGEA